MAATPAHVRSTSRFVLAAGLTFAATMLAALVALFVQERQQAIDAQLERNALYARVLEDHVTRSVDTAARSLATLAGTLSEQGLRGAAMKPAELAKVLVSLPQLRAVTLLDLQGRVLASSTPADGGRRIDLKQLGPLPAEGFDAIGPYVAGRGLSDAAFGGASGAVPNTVGFIPLLRRVKVGDDELLLVALIHPEGLTNQIRLMTIRDPASHAMLAGLDGRLYIDTANPRAGPPLKDHQRFAITCQASNTRATGVPASIRANRPSPSASRARGRWWCWSSGRSRACSPRGTRRHAGACSSPGSWCWPPRC